MPRRRSFALPDLRRRRSPGPAAPTYVPADPARVVAGPMDPTLGRIRSGLVPHRRRLWFRRIIRRAWLVAAGIAAGVLVVAVLQRLFPIPSAMLYAAAIPVLGLLALLVAAVRIRPTIGETAIAVDAEGGTGDRLASALAFAAAMPTTTAPGEADDETIDASRPDFDLVAAEGRFVRRQRRDAAHALATVRPDLFRPRFSPRPAVVALVASVLIVPALLLPNPQDLVIQRDAQVRAEAQRQAQRIEDVAKDLEGKGVDPTTPVRRSPRSFASSRSGSASGRATST